MALLFTIFKNIKHSLQHSRFMHVIFRDRFGDRGAAKGRDEVVTQCNGWQVCCNVKQCPRNFTPMSTKIHPNIVHKCPRNFTPMSTKIPPNIVHKCPRQHPQCPLVLTPNVHNNCPFLSSRILPPTCCKSALLYLFGKTTKILICLSCLKAFSVLFFLLCYCTAVIR